MSLHFHSMKGLTRSYPVGNKVFVFSKKNKTNYHIFRERIYVPETVVITMSAQTNWKQSYYLFILQKQILKCPGQWESNYYISNSK